MPNPRLMPLAAALMLATACQSPKPTPAAACFGHLGPEVFALAQDGDPAGDMELEIAADGTVFEAEATIAPADLPVLIRDAAEATAGKSARMIGAEIEYSALGRTYEVAFLRDDREVQYVFDEAGNLLESEFAMNRRETPAAVIDAALRRLPGSLSAIDRLELADGTEVFHVKTAIGTARYKAIVSPAGEVLRAVREARAEIEIPLPEDEIPVSIGTN